MSEMIERGAEAMAKADTGQPWFSLEEFVKQHYRSHMRRAIEAMREPTEDMLVAFIENTDVVGIVAATGEAQLAACKSDWQAMIDKALSDE